MPGAPDATQPTRTRAACLRWGPAPRRRCPVHPHRGRDGPARTARGHGRRRTAPSLIRGRVAQGRPSRLPNSRHRSLDNVRRAGGARQTEEVGLSEWIRLPYGERLGGARGPGRRSHPASRLRLRGLAGSVRNGPWCTFRGGARKRGAEPLWPKAWQRSCSRALPRRRGLRQEPVVHRRGLHPG